MDQSQCQSKHRGRLGQRVPVLTVRRLIDGDERVGCVVEDSPHGSKRVAVALIEVNAPRTELCKGIATRAATGDTTARCGCGFRLEEKRPVCDLRFIARRAMQIGTPRLEHTQMHTFSGRRVIGGASASSSCSQP